MKKFNMNELKPMSTLMSMATLLDPNENGIVVDQREYRSMIGSHLYLTVTRSNFSSPCAFVHTFKLPHAPHIGQQFSESSVTSNTLLRDLVFCFFT
jgi:hypothetical protein